MKGAFGFVGQPRPSEEAKTQPARPVAQAPEMSETLARVMKETGPKTSKFVPGKPGRPRSGVRATELLRDPVTLSRLADEVADWEKKNPNRKLLGPTIKSMLPGVSDAQARTIAKRINQQRIKMMRG